MFEIQQSPYTSKKLYYFISDLISFRRFDELDEFIRNLEIKNTTIVNILTVISMTYQFHDQLPSRVLFVDKSEQEMIYRIGKTRTDSILRLRKYRN